MLVEAKDAALALPLATPWPPAAPVPFDGEQLARIDAENPPLGQPDVESAPVLRSSRRGDQLVTVRVVVPEKLDPKQRKLLQELGDTLGMESLGKDTRSLFEKFLDAVGDALS